MALNDRYMVAGRRRATTAVLRTQILASLLVALATTGITSELNGAVIVVDVSGGGDFTQIQPAVNAAADGDTILIKHGTYPSFTLFKKGLVVVAETAATVKVPRWRVAGLGPQQRAVVRGVDGEISLEGNVGTVRAEDCFALGGQGGSSCFVATPANPGAVVSDCSSVSFVRCTIRGGDGGDAGTDLSNGCITLGAIGLVASNSSIFMSECTAAGGNDGDSFFNPTFIVDSVGREGIVCESSQIWITGSEARGGNNTSACIAPACIGSSGLRVVDTLSIVRRIDSVIAGGGGPLGVSPGIIAPPGTVIDFPATARKFLATSPLREHQPGSMSFSGVAGDQVLLLIAFGGGHVDLPVYQGPLLVAPLLSIVFLGTLPTSGDLNVPLPIQDLPPAVDAATIYLQAAFAGSEGQLLGPTSVTTILDASF